MNLEERLELIRFLRVKLAMAEQTLMARERSAEVWATGTDKSWRKAGCRLSSEERMEVSKREARIAQKARKEVEMFRAAVALAESSAV